MTRSTVRRDIHPVAFTGALLRSAFRFPRSAGSAAVRTVVNQLRFTAVQALPLVTLVAVLVGLPLVFTVAPLTAGLGVAGTVDRMLLDFLMRDVGPIVAALVVVVRSATAVTAELATARLTGERRGLEALGVDPVQYYVLPRLVAFSLSVALLSVLFDAIVFGALAVGRARVGDPEFASVVRAALTHTDLVVILGQAAVLGAGVALLSAMEGLEAGDDPVALPIAVSRGTQQAFVWIFVTTALFTVGRYLA